MNTRRLQLFCLLLLFSTLSLFAQRAVVSGQVTDAATGEALHGAHVYLQQYRQGQSSDKEGRFKLMLPKHSPVEVTISYVGYTTRRFTLRLSSDTLLNVRLRQDNRLSDVTVYGSRQDFGVESSQMSAVEMPIAEIRKLPMLFGEVDVMKALQKLPGVQSGGDGHAGIYVRGGSYDQNQITMDGATLYNAEHLKGFVSAINADAVENVVFYKGAFPARYGGQLSSVVDIGMKIGDMQRYHVGLDVGVLSSKIHLEGPIWKNRTSFNVAARASYFDWFVQPILERISENKNALTPYANVNYYDLSAKVVHRFSDKNQLSAFFYMGKDIDNQSPSDSELHTEEKSGELYVVTDRIRHDATENEWGNQVANLTWSYHRNEKISMDVGLSYSKYDYRLLQLSDYNDYKEQFAAGKSQRYEYHKNITSTNFLSEIVDVNGSFSIRYSPTDRHIFRFGMKAGLQRFFPRMDIFQDKYSEKLTLKDTLVTINKIDTVLGKNREYLYTASLYAEDEWNISRTWKANVGLRYALFHADGRSYHSLEPRLSLRWLFRDDMSLKLSYAHMSQGIHQLSSTNLVSPSDIWVPITSNVPLMHSDQVAIGYHYEISKGLNFSVEAYYKYMDNLLEYQEGASYVTAMQQRWDEKVALGAGDSYGVELYFQKRIGKSTGWVSYTWSKARRLFNRSGQELNGGRRFYATNDRRHNLNVAFSHRFNDRWEASLSWTYQSGRRGTLATTTYLNHLLDEHSQYVVSYQNVGNVIKGRLSLGNNYDSGNRVTPYHSGYIYRQTPFSTYEERNGFQLPATHRLDASLSYMLKHKHCSSMFNISVYNVYNQQNISNVYWGYSGNNEVLKGVCLLPIMPSLSYTIKF